VISDVEKPDGGDRRPGKRRPAKAWEKAGPGSWPYTPAAQIDHTGM